MIDTKNIIIIGKTGSGKSTLANILSKSNEFNEDDSSLIKTWRTKSKEFEHERTNYRAIETVGLGDAKLSKEELLEKFEEELGTYIDEGISQIFFVMDDWRLSEKFLTEFFWLRKFFFDESIFDYITIVRNKFFDFKNKGKCEEEINSLIKRFSEENDKDKEFYEKVNEKIIKKGKIICVDNSSVKVDVEINKKRREKSRRKLLDHLNKLSSQNEETYKNVGKVWLDNNYPKNERGKISELNIGEKELRGVLRFKGFVSLKRLNCSNNQLTNLVFDNCKDLVEIQCSNNKFINLNFLKSVSNLEQLNISNCHSLGGSLKTLENLSKLEILFITNTNLDKGLEYLPKSCKKLVCNSDKEYKTTKIAEALSKSNCLEREYSTEYYNLDKWRITNEQNKSTASVVPLERLFVIRSNIKKFVDKWGIREEEEDKKNDGLKNCLTWSYNKISKLWKKDESNLTELSKLNHPDEFSKQWGLITGIQWTNRAASVLGGSLLLVGVSDPENPNSSRYNQTGGVIAIASPFVEIVTSYANDQIYEAKQRKWDEFVEDTKNLLDNYHELLGILEKIEISKFGEVNNALEKLDKATDSFLESYDEDENGVIDILELIKKEKREKLVRDLSQETEKKEENGQLYSIVEAMRNLEEEITKYRQGITDKENTKEKSKAKRQARKKILEIITDNQSKEKKVKEINENQSRIEAHQIIDLDEWEKEKLENKVEILPKSK